MTRKNKLQAHIIEYNRRREKFRQQYPNWRDDCPEYRKAVLRINKRIKQYRRTIRLIEAREVRIKAAAQLVCDFMDIRSLWHTGSSKDRRLAAARKLFCKYAIEHRLGTTTLAEYLGHANSSIPYQTRKRFTRSFRTDKAAKELWNRFTQFIQDETETQPKTLKVA